MGCSVSKPEDTFGPASAQVRISQGVGSNAPASSALGSTGAERASLESKVVLLGDSGVGKSSLALRFCQGRFSPYHEVTIGAAFLQQIVRLKDGSQLKLHIWDTGGQERFRAMAPLYYRDAWGAVIVYDCSHAPTWESVKFWVGELQAKGRPNCCMAIAANKCDTQDWQVDSKEAREYCESNDFIFVECSAKTGENVGRLFELLANKVYQQMLKGDPR